MTKPIDLEPAVLEAADQGKQFTITGTIHYPGSRISDVKFDGCDDLVQIPSAVILAARSAPEAGKAVDGEAALRSAKPIIEALIAQEYNVETWGLKSRLAAIEAALTSAATEPVAWMFELANARNTETDEPCNWGKPQLSFTPPCAGKYQRNVTPLYSTLASPAPSGAADAIVMDREIGWLIERKYSNILIGVTEPRWYTERPNGDHWWTPVPNDAKRFASKAEAEAYPAYKMIASDRDISITEHVWINDGFSWSHGRAGPVVRQPFDAAPSGAVEARCCSAISPCSWQRHNGLDSVCPTCTAAAGPQAVAPAEEIAETLRNLSELDDAVTYGRDAVKIDADTLGVIREAVTAITSLSARLAAAERQATHYPTIAGENMRLREERDAAIARATASEAEASDLRRKLEEHRKALEDAERKIVELYRAVTPHGNYDNELTINGHRSGNNFADNDETVRSIRRALTTDGGPNG